MTFIAQKTRELLDQVGHTHKCDGTCALALRCKIAAREGLHLYLLHEASEVADEIGASAWDVIDPGDA